MTQLRNMNITGIDGTVSTANSSATPLTGGGVFTGTAEDVTNYGILYVNVYSDVASATDGLSIEQSSDGTNWDHLDAFTIPAMTGKNFSFNSVAKYFRVKYTNGAVAQTEFRLQTIFKSVYGKPSSHRIQDSISSDDDAELIKSVLTAENPSGTFVNLEASDANNLKVAVTEEFGVPARFSKMTETGEVFGVQKGQLNKLRIRPQIANEHIESSRALQGTVSATNIVGQVFKASQDNINSIGVTLESVGGLTTVDNFDSYANTTALQAAWPTTGASGAVLVTAIVKASQSMRLDGGAVVGDTWTKSIAAVDKTLGTLNMDIFQTKEYNKMKFSVFVGDGVNTKSLALSGAIKNGWLHVNSSLSAFVEDGAGTTNEAALTTVGFRLDNRDSGEFAYIENVSLTNAAGSVEFKLWDMGAALPTSGVSTLTGQYTTLGDIGAGATPASSIIMSLEGGKRLYKVNDFVAGTSLEVPSNVLLTSGNYYAVTLHYVDTDVGVYGPDPTSPTQYYNNGYAFTTPNEATAITSIGTYNDLMFIVFSTGDVWVRTTETKFNAVPGDAASFSQFVEGSNMAITDIPTEGEMLFGQEHEEDLRFRPPFLEKGGKMECYYNDDGADSVTRVHFEMSYFYEPPTVNG